MWAPRRLRSGLAAALLLAGCATSAPPPAPVKVREATEAEKGRLSRLVFPLVWLSELPVGGDCPIGLGIGAVDRISAAVAPGGRCSRSFNLLVTEGALARLPDRELQAMLAHEIGHVVRDHFTRARARAEAQQTTQTALGVAGAVASVVPLVGPFLAVGMTATQVAAPVAMDLGARAFSRSDEAEADAFAAALMRQATGEPGCLALASVFERLQAEGSTSGGWLSTHPGAADRAASARAACAGPPVPLRPDGAAPGDPPPAPSAAPAPRSPAP